jgi:hypothetical protein
MIQFTNAVMAVAAAATLSLGLASPAVADNRYYIPVCTGNDIPMNAACRVGGPQGTPMTSSLTVGTSWFVGGSADELPTASPGANPYIPLGVGN